MKNSTRVLIIAVIIVLTFILQMYVVDSLTLFGIKANLFLVVTVALSLWTLPNIAIPFVFVVGLFSDMLFTYTIGKGVVTYLIIMAIIIYTSKLYNKQSTGVAIIVMLVSTVIAELVFWIFNGIRYAEFQNVFSVLFMSLKESVLNIAVILLLKKVFKKLFEEN